MALKTLLDHGWQQEEYPDLKYTEKTKDKKYDNI